MKRRLPSLALADIASLQNVRSPSAKACSANASNSFRPSNRPAFGQCLAKRLAALVERGQLVDRQSGALKQGCE